MTQNNFETCEIEDCPNPARQMRKCSRHYAQSLRGNRDRVWMDTTSVPKCVVSHCMNEANSRKEGAYCEAHYQLKYRKIDPETRILRADDPFRTDAKCWVEDCPKRASQKGLCNGHAASARRGHLAVPPELGIEVNPGCEFKGCEKLADSRKSRYCHTHMTHVRKYGEPVARRTYGKYVDGSESCLVIACESHAVSKGFCGRHVARMSKYNLTVDEFIEILGVAECQNPGCSNTTYLKIDHDHATGAVRGMLCNGCNTGFGLLGEDIDRLAGLIEYKKVHS